MQNNKQILLEKRERLLKQLNALHKDMRHSRSADSSEQVTERENDQVVDALEAKVVHELKQIQQAMQRIESGQYGRCQQCGAAIGEQRLKAIPYTTLCVACAA